MAVSHVQKTRLKTVGRLVLKIGLAGLAAFVSLPLYRAFQARGFEDLHVWHRLMISHEFDGGDYGLESSEPLPAHIQLGQVHLRGEKGGLRISETAMLRLRCNPFWEYIAGRLDGLAQESVR